MLSDLEGDAFNGVNCAIEHVDIIDFEHAHACAASFPVSAAGSSGLFCLPR